MATEPTATPIAQPATLPTFADLVHAELLAAQVTHGPMLTHHDAWGVIEEEVAEYAREVYRRAGDRSPSRLLRELVQVAAMAERAALDLGVLAAYQQARWPDCDRTYAQHVAAQYPAARDAQHLRYHTSHGLHTALRIALNRYLFAIENGVEHAGALVMLNCLLDISFRCQAGAEDLGLIDRAHTEQAMDRAAHSTVDCEAGLQPVGPPPVCAHCRSADTFLSRGVWICGNCGLHAREV